METDRLCGKKRHIDLLSSWKKKTGWSCAKDGKSVIMRGGGVCLLISSKGRLHPLMMFDEDNKEMPLLQLRRRGIVGGSRRKYRFFQRLDEELATTLETD